MHMSLYLKCDVTTLNAPLSCYNSCRLVMYVLLSAVRIHTAGSTCIYPLHVTLVCPFIPAVFFSPVLLHRY